MVHIVRLDKFNESRLVVATQYKSIFNYYLDKLGLTVDELSDIFSELLDFDFRGCYLQLFFLDGDNVWSSLRINKHRTDDKYIPFFIISFESNISITSGDNLNLLESFIESFNTLKSNLDDKYDLKFKLKNNSINVEIYFPEKIDYEFYDKIIYLE